MATVLYIDDDLVDGKLTPLIKELDKSKPSVDVFADGQVRSQDLAGKIAYEIIVEHPMVDLAVVQVLDAWHAANRNNTIRITASDSFTYDTLFLQAYSLVAQKGTYRTMRTRLVGNRVT